jgi:hypothetical protein
MRQLLPFTLSLLTMFAMWLLGNKNKLGWVVGLVNQAFWITFAIVFKAWGLLPLSLVLVFIYSRNLRRWIRDD